MRNEKGERRNEKGEMGNEKGEMGNEKGERGKGEKKDVRVKEITHTSLLLVC